MTRSSDDLANDLRRREALGRFADLRAGDMYQGDEPDRLRPGKWLWIACAGFTLAAFFAVAVAGAPGPADLPTGPGFETCKTRGC